MIIGKKIVDKFFYIVKVTEKVMSFLLVALLLMLILLMSMQITNRYLLKNAFVWTEELCRYIFIWITFIGAGLALRRSEMPVAHFFLELFPPKLQKIFKIIGLFGVMLFVFILTKYGINLVLLAMRNNTLTPALQVPFFLVYIIFPIGGITMFIFSIACIIELITKKR